MYNIEAISNIASTYYKFSRILRATYNPIPELKDNPLVQEDESPTEYKPRIFVSQFLSINTLLE